MSSNPQPDFSNVPPQYDLAGFEGDGDRRMSSAYDMVFSDLFFSPNGELLEIPSDDENQFVFSSFPDDPLGDFNPTEFPPLPQLPGSGLDGGVDLIPSIGTVPVAPAPAPLAPPPSVPIIPSIGSHGSEDGGSSKTRAWQPGAHHSFAVKRRKVDPVPSGTPLTNLTEDQKQERRQRNREHAKRSRVRKKFLLDALQQSVDALQSENDSLRDSIRTHMGAAGEALIAKSVPPVDSLVTNNPLVANRILDDPDYSLVKSLQTAQQNFVITDASQPDNPIVYASSGFLTLTGYEQDHILGRNCRFLQGPETDPRAVEKIRQAIARGEDTSVCLLNYRRDGSTFWNQFFVAGLRDGDGNTVNYVGVQSKVSEEYALLVVEQQNAEFEAKARAASRGVKRK